MRARLLLALSPLIAAAACDPAIVPPKLASEIFDFRLNTAPPSVLRWPSGTTVRVFVASGPQPRAATLEQAFETGARIWNERAFYGEYRLVRTTNPHDADVVLRWSDETPPVITSSCSPAIARAVTTFCIETSENRLRIFPLTDDEVTSSVRMLVSILGTESTQPQSVERLVAHELGHVLGIGQHSLNPQDLMYAGDLQRAVLSVRDAATIQILYHTQPDITP
jgi:predicted Zn-dependent protease